MGLNHLPILLIMAVVALIVFGPKRLPELGHGLGKAITEFRKGTAELTGSHEVSTTTEIVQPVATLTAAPVQASTTASAPAADPSARS